MSIRSQVHSLVADIGGTHTRVALAEGSAVLDDTICLYHNAEHQDLAAVLKHYLASAGEIECQMACVAVAGPVHDGVAELTNLDWRIDTKRIARFTGADRVVLLNDLQAKGHTLGHISRSHLREIIPQPSLDGRATQLVIGIGTGFNAASVHHLASGRFVAPAEAGHASMPVGNGADLDLAQFIAERQGFAGVEDVLSGRGIEHIHAWLGHRDQVPSTASAAEIFQALAACDPRAEETLTIFVRLLGIAVGNLALNALPFGGIFFAGGVSRAIAPHLTELGFAEAFRDKGRFSEFMESFGVSVIEDDYAALTGCARYLADCY